MSFPRYESYKDSGVEWLGEVPEHWDVVPFYRIAKERQESNKGMVEDNLLSLSYGRIVQKDISLNDGLLPESFETYQIIRQGDIVFRLTDLQNDKRSLRTAIVEETGIITSAYLAAMPISIEPRYLSHLLRAYDILKVFYSMGGGLRQSMKFSDVKRLPTLFPSTEEQQIIATFLDRETAKIDALIAEQQRLIELLKEKRQAVISHAVTKGLNPDAPMKDSGIEWLGEMPEHWSAIKLFFLTHKIGDGLHGTPQCVDVSDFLFINGNNLSSGAILITESTRCVSKEEYEKHRVILGDNSLLMSINGTIGSVAFYQGETVMLGKSAAYINCSNKLSRNFLYFFLQSTSVKTYFELEVTGTTIFNLSLESIRNLSIALPSLIEQSDITVYLDSRISEFDSLLMETQRAISLLQERRTALISAAVTGKIDVRGLVSTALPEEAAA